MANNNDGNYQKPTPQGNVFITPLEEVMPQSMLPYAEFVILDRALPRVEDGLKPVQRRILYTMMEMGLTPDKPHKKSARIVGDCMGKYHPHGDSSVYDAMVRMAQDFNMRMTLVNGHGNFGSVDGDPAAAMRYTEARLEPLALELLRDLDKETVSFSFNFDDSLLEPDILPGRFPNLLVNGANGIAVGLATNIPTHNLHEVIDGVCAFIDNPNISLKEMMRIIPGPDFSTGGYIIANELVQAYETGKGKITLRAKYSVEVTSGKKLIIITELPYQTNKAELLKKIMLLREDKKELLSGIIDIVDESDRTGMRAVITCKREADVDAILATLFKYTDLECTFGINMVAIAGGKPRQLGLLDIIKYYVSYQRLVVLRRAKYELKEALARRHIVEGLIIGVHNVDEVVRIIKNAESTPDARQKLRERFGLSEKQAQAILDLRLARLAKLEVRKLEEELEELNKKIDRLQKIIGDKSLQMDIVKQELKEIKRKYKCERRTRILGKTEQIHVKRDDVKRAVTEWAVCLTAEGKVKFVEKEEFLSKFKKPLAANSKLTALHTQIIFCDSDAKLVSFTNTGNCAYINLDDVEPSDYRTAGFTLHQLNSDVSESERAVKLFTREQMKGEALFFTRLGMIKRTAWDEYNLNKGYYQAFKFNTAGDEVTNVETYDTDEVSTLIFVTKKGLCLNAYKDNVPAQGRVAGGVRGIALSEGDEVLFSSQINGEGEIMVVTAAGGYKRVISSLIDPLKRACKGVMIADVKDSGGLLFADYVTVPYTLAVINKDGSVTELSTEDLPIENRGTKGKKLKRKPPLDAARIIPLKQKSDSSDGSVQKRHK